MNNSSNVWFLLGAAVVGIVSAAGVFIIEQFRQDERRHAFNRDLNRLDGQLTNLRKELETIQKLQEKRSIESKPSRRKVKSISSAVSTTSTEDYNSALDSSDLEFYDISSDEETTSDSDWNEIDTKLESKNKTEIQNALSRMEELIVRRPQNVDLLWRKAKACKILATETKDIEKREEFVNKGIEACKAGIKLKPGEAPCHKWMAILVGLKSEFLPIKEKILSGDTFRKHCELAISLTPEDPFLHHLLGRYAYELAQLTWFERTVAQTLFAELPTFSHEDAMTHFMKAEKLSDSEWKENRLYIAKCSLAVGRTEKAIEWLNKAENANSIEEDKVHEEVKNLLEMYKPT